MFLPLIVCSIVSSYLDQYTRPFTLLDINTGYAIQEAEKYPESVFVICGNGKPLNNVIVLKEPSPQELKHLSTCEHFDVILAQKVENDLLPALQKMAHLLLVETDVHLSEKSTLERTSYIHPKGEKRDWTIHCNFHEKSFLRKDKQPPYSTLESKWIPGINLITYLMLGGHFPSREKIASQIRSLPNQSDFALNNFVLQGIRLTAIDCNDYHHSYHSDFELIYLFKKLIQEPDPNEFLRKINMLYNHHQPFFRDFSQYD